MKFTKLSILFIILCLGFIIQSELFILDSWNFNTNSYYSCTIELSEENISCFIDELSKQCEANNVNYFITDMQVISTYYNQLNIYCDDSVKKIISDNNKLYEGIYKSIGSGNLQVHYNDIDQIINNNIKIRNISFVGKIDDINSITQKLRKEYDLSSPMINGSNEKDVIYLVWFTIISLMLFITGIYIIYNKKNVIVGAFFGADINKKIIVSILEEILTDYLIFILAHKFIFSFFGGEYMKNEVLILYSLGVLLCSLLYISYRFYDISKVIKSNGDNIYLSKIITAIQIIIITFVSIGVMTCKDKIIDNLLYDYEQTFANNYSDYNLITFQGDNILNYSKIEQVYKKHFEQFKPVVCYKALEDDYCEYICINGYAKKQISNLIQKSQANYEDDILIFIPADIEKNIIHENIDFCANQIISNANDLDIKFISYDSYEKIIYIDNNASLSSTITHVAYKPVIIYCPIETCVINKQYFKFPYGYNSVLLSGSEDEISFIFNENHISNYAVTNVYAHTRYYNNIKNKLLSIYSIIIFFSIIIHVILSIINAIYYFHKNSCELCLKKVTGYSFLLRYANVFKYIILKYILLTIVIIIGGQIINTLTPLKTTIVMIVLCLIEIITTIIEVIHLEHKNIIEIFKGKN